MFFFIAKFLILATLVLILYLLLNNYKQEKQPKKTHELSEKKSEKDEWSDF